MEKTPILDQLLEQTDLLQEVPLGAGLEADVVKICSDEFCVALKTWNKGASPDVGYQFSVLQALRAQGISVSMPLGWGYDEASHKVLVTSFDGQPIDYTESQNVNQLAGILAQIHRFPVSGDLSLRTYDFLPYFFPDIEKTPDLLDILKPLCEKADIRQDRLVHGDFNMLNILESNGAYTVIDWTNAQLGDARYDLAWASFLIKVYVDEKAYDDFLNVYFQQHPSSDRDLEIFEAIACLRWLQLYRVAELPMLENTVAQVNDFIEQNKHLPEELLLDAYVYHIRGRGNAT
ncbi:MAG TPA: aminoglycoside phosphotransferase family protein [Bacillales bacterium]|nr:aminoglycoside phosphotransferase family protein [Bacillales bacterium]